MSAKCVVQAPAGKLSMTEKERLLPKLVEEGWLADMPDQQGTYSIGVRNHLPASCLYWNVYACVAAAVPHAPRQTI